MKKMRQKKLSLTAALLAPAKSYLAVPAFDEMSVKRKRINHHHRSHQGEQYYKMV